MIRRFVVALAACALLFAAVPAPAAQVVSTTQTNLGHGVIRYDISWISDSSGNVSADVRVPSGQLYQARFYPGSGGAAPTAAYDVTLVESAPEGQTGADLLIGGGADLSATTVKILQIYPPVYRDKGYTLTLTVAAAGDSNSGHLVLYLATW